MTTTATSTTGLGALPRSGVLRLGPRAGFAVVTAALTLLMAAAAAPSPLYPVYQHRWTFSAAVLTAVFAIYVAALLAALLVVGSLSDHVGRRPALAGALALAVVAMGVFAGADSVGALLLARALQGLATGAAMAAVSAWLVDLAPAHRPDLGATVNGAAPPFGLALGAIGSGLLVQFAPAPTRTVYVLLLAALVVSTVLVLGAPETVTRRPGALASLRPRVAVPRAARRSFVLAAPALVATWALAGFFLSLGPSVTASTLHVSSHLVGGAVVATLMTASGIATLATTRARPRPAVRGGAFVLGVGVALALVAVDRRDVVLFFVGAAVAGVGFGTTFLGAFRTIAAHATPEHRAGLFSAVFVLSYLGFSVPTLIAGEAVPRLGLAATTTAYGLGVTALALVAAAATLRRRR